MLGRTEGWGEGGRGGEPEGALSGDRGGSRGGGVGLWTVVAKQVGLSSIFFAGNQAGCGAPNLLCVFQICFMISCQRDTDMYFLTWCGHCNTLSIAACST